MPRSPVRRARSSSFPPTRRSPSVCAACAGCRGRRCGPSASPPEHERLEVPRGACEREQIGTAEGAGRRRGGVRDRRAVRGRRGAAPRAAHAKDLCGAARCARGGPRARAGGAPDGARPGAGGALADGGNPPCRRCLAPPGLARRDSGRARGARGHVRFFRCTPFLLSEAVRGFAGAAPKETGG